jgi:preprotein translocase subunit SecA
MGLFSKMFGGNKSEKDVRAILPLVTKINQHFDSFQSISNDELRSKTLDFRQRIKDALKNIDAQIADTKK